MCRGRICIQSWADVGQMTCAYSPPNAEMPRSMATATEPPASVVLAPVGPTSISLTTAGGISVTTLKYLMDGRHLET